MRVNVLVGKSPAKGSVPAENDDWDGSRDPLLTVALDVVEETLHANEHFERDLQPFFRVQMAYLLLWSSIERYLSLRYHLDDRVMEKVDALAGESAFIEGVRSLGDQNRAVYRADRPTNKVLAGSADAPLKRLRYYHQLRSNIAHRGKGVLTDHSRVYAAARELLGIFRNVLADAFAKRD